MKGFRLTSANISRGYSVSLAMAGVWQTFGKFTSSVGNFQAKHLIDKSFTEVYQASRVMLMVFTS
jgi:hypothetical protein